MSKRVTAEPDDYKGAARAWCWTFFLPDEARPVPTPEEQVAAQHNAALRYFVCQREIAPETGRVHWQAYGEFTAPCKFTAVQYAIRVCLRNQRFRELRSGEWHAERRRGRRDQARDYCRKDESRDPREGSGPFEWGMYLISSADWSLERCHIDAVFDLYMKGEVDDASPFYTTDVLRFVPCIKL